MGTPVHRMVEGAALAVAPYSHFVEVDGWVFLMGQFAMTPGVVVARTISRTRRAVPWAISGSCWPAAGLGFEHVVSARVFLVDFAAGYEPRNRVWETYFAPGRRPARTCVGVTALAWGATVEIDFIARRP
jgi:enamine deaminase RidA (YjgF/YER057c/UK114 family)